MCLLNYTTTKYFLVSVKHNNILFYFYLDDMFRSYLQSTTKRCNVSLFISIICCTVIKSRRMRWPGHVAHTGEERGVCRVLVGKPEGKRPLGRPRRRWVDNIRMDLQEVGCVYMD